MTINQDVSKILLCGPFYGWGNWGRQKLRNFLRITSQQVREPGFAPTSWLLSLSSRPPDSTTFCHSHCEDCCGKYVNLLSLRCRVRARHGIVPKHRYDTAFLSSALGNIPYPILAQLFLPWNSNDHSVRMISNLPRGGCVCVMCVHTWHNMSAHMNDLLLTVLCEIQKGRQPSR